MPYEVEAKIKLPIQSTTIIQDYLKKQGFTLIIQGTEEDMYFNHPCKDFAQTDEALRIRKKMNQTQYSLTYKGKKLFKDTKTRQELILNITDPDTMKAILEALGFTFVAKVKKHRMLYKKNQITITLDDLPGLGLYMEFEKEVEHEDKVATENDNLKQFIQQFLQGLQEGITPHYINKSYLEMLLENQIKDNSKLSS